MKVILLLHIMCLCFNIVSIVKCTCFQNEKSEFPGSTSATVLFHSPSKLTSVAFHKKSHSVSLIFLLHLNHTKVLS